MCQIFNSKKRPCQAFCTQSVLSWFGCGLVQRGIAAVDRQCRMANRANLRSFKSSIDAKPRLAKGSTNSTRQIHYHASGKGHVYQSRFKSFPIQDDAHFLDLLTKWAIRRSFNERYVNSGYGTNANGSTLATCTCVKEAKREKESSQKEMALPQNLWVDC